MRAAVFAGGELTIEEAPDPIPQSGELVLRVSGAGICGSDLHAGQIGVPDGQILGHEFSGIVARIGAGVTGFREGDAVCSIPAIGCGQCAECSGGWRTQCRRGRLTGIRGLAGGYAEYVLTGAAETMHLPANLEPEYGALVEPLSVSLQAIERAHLEVGEPVLVIGACPIGLAAILWARVAGAGEIVASDPVSRRRELALACGATAACDPREEAPAEVVRRLSGRRPRVAIDAAGVSGSLMASARALDVDGIVVVVGIHLGADEIQPSTLVWRSANLTFSNWSRDEHFRTTVKMIGLGRLDPRPMVSACVSLDEAPAAFAQLRTPSDEGKVLITPWA